MSVIFLVVTAILLILMVFWEIQELLEVFLEVMVLLTTLFLLLTIYLMIFLMVKLTFPSVSVWIYSKTICFTTSTLETTMIWRLLLNHSQIIILECLEQIAIS